MKVYSLDDLKESNSLTSSSNTKFELYQTDENGRKIEIFNLCDCCLVGQNLFYPNVFAHSFSDGNFYKVIREEIMSLRDLEDNKFTKKVSRKKLNYRAGNFFFFCFNTENYYHFIYDTLPYLISFFAFPKKRA
jgi:hypothetical protein